eukprot:TRINITY_DN11444_c0_g1_i3.p1 TRINITY_DN11444_c0_g1~~TRINITY_DN11444_c0_g1_i3.p1  ORF type:complete len:776 (+),score=169.98 TRINITY_DN11444_c0_g1_i3:66-2393(+)
MNCTNGYKRDKRIHRIRTIDEIDKHGEKIDSLLGLFRSESFTLDQLLVHLFQRFDQQGIQDYLVNRLYEYNFRELMHYTAQFSSLVLHYNSGPMTKYLSDSASKDILACLRILWTLEAYAFGSRKDRAECEQIVESVRDSIRKSESLWNYAQTIKKFVANLVKVSLTLKTFNPMERKARLQEFMHAFNMFLRRLRVNKGGRFEAGETNEGGIAIPFADVKDTNKEGHSSYMIVRIIHEESACFSTKKRCPYKIVVETIDPKDMKFYHSKEKNTPSEIATPPEINFDQFDLLGRQTSRKLMEKENKFKDLEAFTKAIEIEAQKSVNLQALGKFIVTKEMLDQVRNSQLTKEIEVKLEQRMPREARGNRAQTLLPQARKKRRVGTIGLEMPAFILKLHEERKPAPNIPQFAKRRIKRRASFAVITERPSKRKHCHHLYPEIPLRDKVAFLKSVIRKCPEKASDIETIIMGLSKQAQKKREMDREAQKNCENSTGPWGQLWEKRAQSIRSSSPFGHFPSYKLRCIILKGDDDLRQEALAMAIIAEIASILRNANLSMWLKPYEILVTGPDSGILECVTDALSLDALKKRMFGKSLLRIFEEVFENSFEEAQKNFVESLAGYSLVCYLLQVKDRHNGNILLDAAGHLVHIDYGFLLGTSPGGMTFESAPFKLTSEYLELMGGKDSPMFLYFKTLLAKGFLELRKHVDKLVESLQAMENETELPIFADGYAVEDFILRFELELSDDEAICHVEELVEASLDNWRTTQYDNYQKMTNGILP